MLHHRRPKHAFHLALSLVFVLKCLTAPAETVTLAWDRNPETAVAGYRLYYGTSPGIYSAAVDAGNQTQVILKGLLTAKMYFAAVAAYSSTGTESLKSESISFATEGTSSDPEPPAPAPAPAPAPEPDPAPPPPVTDSIPPPLPPEDPEDSVVHPRFLVEAESGEATRPMVPAEDSDASGGEYIKSNGGGRNGSEGSLTLTVKAQEKGDYFIWGLVKLHPKNEGALFLSHDGGPPVYFAGDQSPELEGGEWEWICLRDSRDDGATLQLTGQKQTLDFFPMGFTPAIDCLVFTTDPHFHPADEGAGFTDLTAAMASDAEAAQNEDEDEEKVDLGKIASTDPAGGGNATVRGTGYPEELPDEPGQDDGDWTESLELTSEYLEISPINVFGGTRGDSLLLEVARDIPEPVILEFSDNDLDWWTVQVFHPDAPTEDHQWIDYGVLWTAPQRIYRLSPARE